MASSDQGLQTHMQLEPDYTNAEKLEMASHYAPEMAPPTVVGAQESCAKVYCMCWLCKDRLYSMRSSWCRSCGCSGRDISLD